MFESSSSNQSPSWPKLFTLVVFVFIHDNRWGSHGPASFFLWICYCRRHDPVWVWDLRGMTKLNASCCDRSHDCQNSKTRPQRFKEDSSMMPLLCEATCNKNRYFDKVRLYLLRPSSYRLIACLALDLLYNFQPARFSESRLKLRSVIF